MGWRSSVGLDLRFQTHVCVFCHPFFFFLFFFQRVNNNITCEHCAGDKKHCLCIVHGSHNTIHPFKNYFATVFSVFNFSKNKLYPNGLQDGLCCYLGKCEKEVRIFSERKVKKGKWEREIEETSPFYKLELLGIAHAI